MQNQFAQQGRHIHYAAFPGHGFCQSRLQIERSHRNRSRHRNRVRNAFGYPHRTVGGNHPGTVAGVYRHDAAGRVDQLIAIVKMQRNFVTGGVVVN
jgi:hypothetical protein